jgi:CDP-glucose 4,6-dehydratase
LIDVEFWKDKRVFLTGHTGFKGSWLSILLNYLGADVTGFSLQPPTSPSMSELCGIDRITKTIIGDIRDYKFLLDSIQENKPDIVIHMAAQPLVRDSYTDPINTYSTNVMGTVNILEAVRQTDSVKAVLNVTTDKCYENKEWYWGYREVDALGGYDPYSNSKACSELVTSAFINSFFNSKEYSSHGVSIATARAGNVIGGGDWAKDRLIPDFLSALNNGEELTIRNPNSIRPWQHVLEPLSGYLVLVEKMYKSGQEYSGSWNFGPDEKDAKTVEWIIKKLYEINNKAPNFNIINENLHEATYLKLDCSKAKSLLGWEPTWNLKNTLTKIVEWNQAFLKNENLYHVTLKQIKEYFSEKV